MFITHNFLYYYSMEVSEAHYDIKGHRRTQVIAIQTQVSQFGCSVFIVHVVRVSGADLSAVYICKDK